jgi:ribonuclease BN (tRNA processing enzyme)
MTTTSSSKKADGLRFTVIGSGTALPDADRGPAAFLVQVPAGTVLVDGGSGTLRALAVRGVDPLTLSAGVYSHRHVDHTGDLVPLLFALKVHGRRASPYPIFAGQGFGAFLDGLRTVYGSWMEPPGGVAVTELSLREPILVELIPGLRLRTAPAAHSAGALHLRFEFGDVAVVFSGDTGPSEALVTLAAGADLLVCECASSASSPVPGHLTPSDVAAIASRARPEEIWLTHFYPRSDPDRAVAEVAEAGIPTRRAADGDVRSW